MSLDPNLRTVEVCILWNVQKLIRPKNRRELPKCRISPMFNLQGCEYMVEFGFLCGRYSLTLLRVDNEEMSRPPFNTSVSIVQGSQTCLTQDEDLFCPFPFIWSCSSSTLHECVRDYNTAGLQFKMVFSTDNSRDLLPRRSTELKSDQTPIYREGDLCLQNLSLDFDKLLKGQTDSKTDVELRCGDHTFRAHGSILGARSKVFSKMLQADMVEGRTGLVEVSDMDAGVFREFVRYLYTGTLPNLTVGSAKALYEAGDRYAVGSLARRCADFLSKNMLPKDALECLVLADAHNDQYFKEKAVAYVLAMNLPLQDDRWLPFSDKHPKIAADVLLRKYKSLYPKNSGTWLKAFSWRS